MATIKDLRRWHHAVSHCKRGYGVEQDYPRSELVELGYNAGLYGWNWTAYYHAATDALIVSYYRNVPNYITEK